MAAIDLERGLEHGGHGWGQERSELMDNFDSEMQEWEDQLQDIQKKIEELYNEVQARRGANDITSDAQKNIGNIECGLGQNSNLFATEYHSKNHQTPHHYGNGCNYSPSGYSYLVSEQHSPVYRHTNGVPEIGDLLQDYLGQGKQISRKNNGARHVRFSDTIKVSSDVPSYQDGIKTRSAHERIGQEQFYGSFVETENKRNRVSQRKTSPCRESCSNKENACGKPPLKQRESVVGQPRPGSQLPNPTAESSALDRKCFGPGGLGDRKGSSPSVLRKFGAMLHENEGKLLTESGVVTPQGQAPEPKCPTPICQRKALGGSASGRAPGRVPTQKCQADCDVQTAEAATSQEQGSATDCGRQNLKDLRGGYSSAKGCQPSPQQSPRRAQVQGSPKPRPRAHSGTDRDGARKTASQQGEPKMDYTVSNGSPGALRLQRGGLVCQTEVKDEGLIELLDMLDIQHEYSSNARTGHSTYRQDTEENTEFSSGNPKSFSRPARPANQRPPSRWASTTGPPTARLTVPSSPTYCPPSSLTRPPSPMIRTPSPALKHRNLLSYSLQTETVIM